MEEVEEVKGKGKGAHVWKVGFISDDSSIQLKNFLGECERCYLVSTAAYSEGKEKGKLPDGGGGACDC